MATTNTTTTLEGIFKRVYDNKVRFIYPNGVRLIKDIPFRGGDKRPGESFNAAITLVFENGMTYLAAGAGAATLISAAVGETKRASINPDQMILRSQVDYESIAKASTAGPRAFVQSTKHIVANMANSFRKRQEIDVLYGQQGLGVVESVSTTTAVFTAASWAPGIWAGTEGAVVDFFDTTLATARTSGTASVVESVSFADRSVTFTATLAGAGAVVATDKVFFESAMVTSADHSSMLGIHGIISASSGSVFGIAVSNTLWRGNSVLVGGAALEMIHLQEAAARIVEKGGGEGKLCCYVSTATWVDLIQDLSALRRFQKADGNARYEAGAEAITFWTQSGPVEIKPSIFVKGEFAYLLDLGSWSRIGAQDFAFGDPAERQVFHRLENAAGYDARAYSNQSVFCDAIGHNTLISGITNSN
jgi:hypothetical protein